MRILRTLIWLIALTILIVMGCVVALFFLVTPETVQDKLTETLASHGLSIKLNEAPVVRVLPTIRVTLPSARVENSQQETVFYCRSAHFDVNPIWLAARKINIGTLTVDGLSWDAKELPTLASWLTANKTDATALFPDVIIQKVIFSDSEIQFSYNGREISVLNLAAEIAEPSPQMHGAVALNGQGKISPDDLLLDFQAAFILDLNLAEGRIGLENVLAQGEGTQAASPFDFAANAPMLKLTSDTFYANSAQITLKNASQTTQLTVAELNIAADQWLAPDMRLHFVSQTPTGVADFDIRSPIQVNLIEKTLKAEHLQGAILLPGMEQPTSVSGKIKTQYDTEVTQLELFGRLHDAPMSFQGQLSGFETPAISGQLVLGRVKLADLSLLSTLHLQTSHPAPIDPETDTVPVEASADPEVSAPATNENAAPSDATPPVPAENQVEVPTTPADNSPETAPNLIPTVALNAGGFIKTQAVETPIAEESVLDKTVSLPQDDYGFLNHFTFNGNVVVGELLSDQLRLIQMKSPMTVQGGELRLDKITALAYDGRLNGKMSLNHLGHWNVVFKASNVNLQRLLTDAGSTALTPGTLNLQANLYGENLGLTHLNGQIGLAASKTQAYGMKLSDALRRIEKGKSPEIGPEFTSPISQLKTVITITDLVAKTEELSVTIDAVATNGYAQVDLGSDALTGALTGTSSRGMKTKVYLSGAWYHPTVSLNIDEIKADNGIVEPKRKDKPSQWDRLKQFFSDRL